MYPVSFDATLDVCDFHLIEAGFTGPPRQALAVVREAIVSVPGAGWVDSDWGGCLPAFLRDRWVTVYEAGTSRQLAQPDADRIAALLHARIVEALRDASLTLRLRSVPRRETPRWDHRPTGRA